MLPAAVADNAPTDCPEDVMCLNEAGVKVACVGNRRWR